MKNKNRDKLNANYKVVKKAKVDCITIPLLIYGDVKVCVVSPKETRRLIELWKQELDFGARTHNYLVENNRVLILFNTYSEPYLVHELVHAVDFIMDYIGHTYEETDEPSAYLTEYLFKELQIKCKKWK